MSETDSVDDCLALLRENGYSSKKVQFSRDGVKDSLYKPRFSQASKARDDKDSTPAAGRPDMFAALYSTDVLGSPLPLVIIVECKKLRKDHGEIESSPKTTAVGGVRHYMECFWKSGKCGEDVIGIAFSGHKESYKVSFFALCSAQNKIRNFAIKELQYNGNEIVPFTSLLDEVYSFTNGPIKKSFTCNGTLYCSMSVSELTKLTICSPSFNRYASEGHVDEIVECLSKAESVVCKGVLIIAVLRCKYYVLDGQHRLEAYKQLSDRGYKFAVALQIIQVQNKEEMAAIYEEHYKLRGASVIDRKATDKAEQTSYQLANKILEFIKKQYGKKKTDSGKFLFSGENKPYIDRAAASELLIEYLDSKGSHWLDRPMDEIISRIDELNQKFRDNTPVKKNGESYTSKILNPCTEWGCWLGLVKASEWLD